MKDSIADLAAGLAKTAGQNFKRVSTAADGTADLDRRYQQIGISAVAAAVRYQGTAKNPAYAPVPTKWQERAGEAAA